MKNSEKRQFLTIMNTVIDLYNRKQLSTNVWRIWWAVLKDYSLKEVSHALEEHIKVSPFFPRPSDVIKYCKTKPEKQYHELIKIEHIEITEEQRQLNLKKIEELKRGIFKVMPGGSYRTSKYLS